MLARGLERRRQTSLTVALGARRSRVVREPIIESLILSLAGGAAGLAIAFAATHAILAMVFPSVPGVGGVPINASPSTPVLLFAFAVSLVTGLAFGIAPAWMATRVDPMDALRGARGLTAPRGTLPRAMLIVGQAALSLMLLAAAGLLTSALRGLENQSFGFERDDRTVAHFSAGLSALGQDQLTPLYDRIRDAVSRVPGVAGVALANYSPFGNNSWGTAVWVDGHSAPGPHDDVFSYWNRVTPDYFRVVGTPILRGRDISERDTRTSPHVAVINEAFAHKFFNGEDALGKYFGQHGAGSERDYAVIGIVRDARYFRWDLDKPVGPMFFLPDVQHDASMTDPSADANPGSHYLHDMIIATRPGVRVAPAALRDVMASVDATIPLTSIRSLTEQVSVSFAEQRLIARLTSFFAVLSLVLASIGLYGVTAHDAGRRTSEIGVRIALGATRGQVVRLVLGGALGLIAAGLLMGLPLTFAAGRFLGKQLYGTNPLDPSVILAAVLALGIAALVAASVPALRASLISPVEALRAE
jgi:predicted permease